LHVAFEPNALANALLYRCLSGGQRDALKRGSLMGYLFSGITAREKAAVGLHCKSI
jgi:hypothetical protein